MATKGSCGPFQLVTIFILTIVVLDMRELKSRINAPCRHGGEYGYGGRINALYPSEVGVRMKPLKDGQLQQHYLVRACSLFDVVCMAAWWQRQPQNTARASRRGGGRGAATVPGAVRARTQAAQHLNPASSKADAGLRHCCRRTTRGPRCTRSRSWAPSLRSCAPTCGATHTARTPRPRTPLTASKRWVSSGSFGGGGGTDGGWQLRLRLLAAGAES